MIRLINKLYDFARASLVSSSVGDVTDVLGGSVTTADEDVSDLLVKTEEAFGRITSVHDGYGLIDGHIYFNFGVVVDGRVPREDQRVLVRSKRRDGIDEGMVAESVNIMEECWEVEGDEHHQDACHRADILPKIGRISDISQGAIHVNEESSFSVQDLEFRNFTPRIGDWIALKPISDERDCKIQEISPLRTRAFNGEITELNSKCGVVNNEVYFYVEDCGHIYRPEVGDIVKGTGIENTLDESFRWRLVNVSPIFTGDSRRIEQRVMIKLQNDSTLIQNKQGIEITSSLDFACVNVGERKCLTAWIRNDGSQKQTLLNCAFTGRSNHQFYVTDPVLDSDHNSSRDSVTSSGNQKPLIILPAQVARVIIICDAKNLGKTRELLVFQFEGFTIGRYIYVQVRDSLQSLLYCPRGSNTRQNNIKNQRSKDISGTAVEDGSWKLPGRRPERNTSCRLPVFLPKFPIPPEMWTYNENESELLNRISCLQEELNMDNYKQKFSTILFLEEIQSQLDMQLFDMDRVVLRLKGEYLALEVPGLAEGRPSLLVGDSVIAMDPDEATISYEGCIHEVRGDEIYLKFHQDFHDQFTGKDYNIAFSVNRTPARRSQLAVSLWRRIGLDTLFPIRKSTFEAHSWHFDDRLVHNTRLNDRQLQAVRCVVEGKARPAPYIIYGPPGTGKTVTLVEAALQVFLQRTGSRILICTPSNSAADLVCERLHETGHFMTSDMVRLNAFHRREMNLSEVVQMYTDGSMELNVIVRYRVIVATCTACGILYGLGLYPGHFTHVFIDEAGQATEPETLIPICLASVSGSVATSRKKDETDYQIILAGDPKQLGPVLRNRLANRYGLQISLLERLSQRPVYARNNFRSEGYNPLYVTKLVDNYRSHPALLHLPSACFYDNELVSKADKSVTNCLLGWKHMAKGTFPILFHGIRGEDLQEIDSPSWFNVEEVFRVVCYLQSLYHDLNLSPEDVGIITPYRKQVEKIRIFIDSLDVMAPKVGSVEEFQGQERLAVIVSTVRSSDSWIDFDGMHNLGFVFNEKRFNVTITRAKALLVIVGNPFVLMKDINWRQLIKFCLLNDAYKGCEEFDVRRILLGDAAS